MICKFRGLRLKRSSIAKIGAEGTNEFTKSWGCARFAYPHDRF